MIVHYLEKMNHRDRLRMFGSFFKSIIMMLPVLVFLWSAWYFYVNGERLLRDIVSDVSRSTVQATQGSFDSLFEGLVPQR